MKFSILHPTRRYSQALDTQAKWLLNADAPVEYIFSLDMDAPKWMVGIRNENRSAVDAINNAAKVATGDVFIVVSDDTGTFEHWDTALRNEIGNREDFVMKCQDGIQPTLITMPVMDRAYYNRFRYVYYPGYRHMFCDTELTEVAHILGRVVASDLLFPHNHYTVTGNRDELNERNDSTWEQGQTLYEQRKAVNFGL